MSSPRTLIVGLGNDVLADDAVGVLAARKLRDTVEDPAVTIRETAEHGIALLDYFIGYDRAILLDAIATGQSAPGTIHRLDPDHFRHAYAPSPHYAGLPEMLTLAEEMQLDYPRQFIILAVEVQDVHTLGGAMTPAVEAAIVPLCQRVLDLL